VQVDDMILVSCDDHVIEPRHLFERHVPHRGKDKAPKSVMDDTTIRSTQAWRQRYPVAGAGR
jgi:hypothetical protein